MFLPIYDIIMDWFLWEFDLNFNVIQNVGMLIKSDYLKLHISVLLSGFTGLFARLVDLNEVLIVFYRMIIAFLIFTFMFLFMKKKPKTKDISKIIALGVLLAVHLIFFFGSIKYANVSIGVVCYSLVGFFTVLFEPFIRKTKFSFIELFYSLIAVFGIWLIFNFDSSYRFGIVLGVISAALFAIYTLCNKVVEADKSPDDMLIFELLGGSAFMIVFLPFYLYENPVMRILPAGIEWFWLFILAFFCTVLLYMFHIGALKTISAATVSLTGNLEPVYGVLFAIIFFNESQELNAAFYIGMILILSSVFLQSFMCHVIARCEMTRQSQKFENNEINTKNVLHFSRNNKLTSFANRSCRVHARSRRLD